jgi:hypothetical protein
MISIVLWWWSDPHGRFNATAPYTADKVHRMARMVSANIAMPHEIVCLTDRPGEIDSSIRAVPIWPDLLSESGAPMGRCWRRIRTFAPEMRELIGPRLCWMDLDAVVMGDLTPLLDRPEDLVLWRSGTTRCPYNGSMVLMTAGCRPQVWTEWTPQAARERARLEGGPGSDQAWIAAVLGPNEATWGLADGVASYWPDCINAGPCNARVVYFPGSLKANADYVRITSPWVADTLHKHLPYNEPEYHWHRWQGRPHENATPRKKRRFSRKVERLAISQAKRAERRTQRQKLRADMDLHLQQQAVVNPDQP